MDHPPTADRTHSPTPTLPRRGVPVDDPGRFSALTAPQREVVDAFLAENRPWALRQARRSYRHLPEVLREQAVDRASTELRTRTPVSLERRALSAELAERLTEALRHVHVGWCLNESSALLRRDGTEPVQPEVRRQDLATFVDEGLGGLERAVMQLEIGAGRDTRTARAALRLGPRQYASHREAGLSKLRDAISAQVIGRACDQHVSSIVAAATGDKAAMEALNAGPHRCRYCAREAQGLRSVLHERLAVAPWPIAIKPAGLLAAKLGALGAVFGSKGAATGGAGALTTASGSGASAAATVLAAAALATGTAAVIGDDSPAKRDGRPGRAAQTADKRPAAKPAAPKGKAVAATAAKAGGSKPSSKDKVGKGKQAGGAVPAGAGTQAPATGSDPGSSAVAAAPAADTAPGTSGSSAGSGSSDGPVTAATKPVTDIVKDTTSTVTDALPPEVGEPVGDTVEDVTDVVDDVGGTVDSLVP